MMQSGLYNHSDTRPHGHEYDAFKPHGFLSIKGTRPQDPLEGKSGASSRGNSSSNSHRSACLFCRQYAPGLNWLGRAFGAVTLKKLERTTAKAFAKDVFINQERKLGARRRSDTVLVSTINDADQGSADVAFRTPLAPYEKSKFLSSEGSMVARLKLKGIEEWHHHESLQLLVFNEEFLVSASHQLALTTSLPFVHTARRSYRLNDPVKCSDRGDLDGLPSATSREVNLRKDHCPTLETERPENDETSLSVGRLQFWLDRTHSFRISPNPSTKSVKENATKQPAFANPETVFVRKQCWLCLVRQVANPLDKILANPLDKSGSVIFVQRQVGTVSTTIT
ncbi:hypothetical protein YC2023_108037 [Brassica napus]